MVGLLFPKDCSTLYKVCKLQDSRIIPRCMDRMQCRRSRGKDLVIIPLLEKSGLDLNSLADILLETLEQENFTLLETFLCRLQKYCNIQGCDGQTDLLGLLQKAAAWFDSNRDAGKLARQGGRVLQAQSSYDYVLPGRKAVLQQFRNKDYGVEEEQEGLASPQLGDVPEGCAAIHPLSG